MSVDREVEWQRISNELARERDALRNENAQLRAVVKVARVAAEFIAWGQPERLILLDALATLQDAEITEGKVNRDDKRPD